jgi:uncharacterized phosphosugar-binding protein
MIMGIWLIDVQRVIMNNRTMNGINALQSDGQKPEVAVAVTFSSVILPAELPMHLHEVKSFYKYFLKFQ